MHLLDSYKKEKLTVNLVWANLFGILILFPIFLIFVLPFFLLWRATIDFSYIFETILSKYNNWGGLIIFSILIAGIVIHELIHGIVWARYADNGFKSIKFGILKKMLTPYCHCKEPLKIKHYIVGALAPLTIMGIIPSIISIFIGDLNLLLFGVFFIVAGCGDILIVKKVIHENKDNYVEDHPSEAGCYIYRK